MGLEQPDVDAFNGRRGGIFGVERHMEQVAGTGDMLLKDGTLGTTDTEKKGPANMLDSIEGTTFSEQQLDALRQSLGKPIGTDTKRQLRVWSARGFITYSNQTGLYTITEEYLKKSKNKK